MPIPIPPDTNLVDLIGKRETEVGLYVWIMEPCWFLIKEIPKTTMLPVARCYLLRPATDDRVALANQVKLKYRGY